MKLKTAGGRSPFRGLDAPCTRLVLVYQAGGLMISTGLRGRSAGDIIQMLHSEGDAARAAFRGGPLAKSRPRIRCQNGARPLCGNRRRYSRETCCRERGCRRVGGHRIDLHRVVEYLMAAGCVRQEFSASPRALVPSAEFAHQDGTCRRRKCISGLEHESGDRDEQNGTRDYVLGVWERVDVCPNARRRK